MAPLPANKVVQALENYYQPLFKDMSLTKPLKWEASDMNKPSAPPKVLEGDAYFGVGRSIKLERLQGGHGFIDLRFEEHLSNRKSAVKAMKGWRARITVVGNKTKGVTRNSLAIRRITDFRVQASYESGEKNPTAEELLTLAKDGFAAREGITKTNGDWIFAVRPIVFEDKACLNCHTESKIGSPAGFMVYAFTKDPDNGKPLRFDNEPRKPGKGQRKIGLG